MRYLASYGVALALIIIVAGWLVSGTLIQGGQGEGNGEQAVIEMITGESAAEDVDETEEAESADVIEQALQSVRVVSYSAREMPIIVPIRGRTKANAVVSTRAETTGVLASIAVSKGQLVAPGDLLCTIDVGTRETRLAQATAALEQTDVALEQANANLQTNQILRGKNLASANTARNFEVAQSAAIAARSSAIASLDGARIELERTEVRAEISGLVQEPLANVGDMLTAGGVCATIVQMNPMLFVGKVAESKIGLVENGSPAQITTVTGQVVVGTVSYVASTANEATRSFAVEITMDNSDGGIRDGMTAAAVISVGATMAHLLPQSVLTLDDAGTIGIKTLDDDIAIFTPVTLVRDTTDGVWVAGLPDMVDVIVLGQEYVKDGQKVAPTMVSDEGSNS